MGGEVGNGKVSNGKEGKGEVARVKVGNGEIILAKGKASMKKSVGLQQGFDVNLDSLSSGVRSLLHRKAPK